jgi:hypothetical protein
MSKKSPARKRAALLVSLSILVSAGFAGSVWAASETPGDTFAASVTLAGAYPEAGIGQEVTISDDGRYVAFLSESQDLDPEAPALSQAYVKDLQTGELRLASRADGPAGAPSNEPREEGHWGVERPFISGNGRYLAFETSADNLVSDFPAATEFPRHVYRRDLLSGKTTLVDRVTGPAGEIIPVEARLQSISDDGRYIVFSDHAEDLEDAGGEHKEGHETIYVRDLQEGITTAVDRASGLAGELAEEGAEEGAISHDARYVLFTSASTNLDPEANGIYQVYRRDLQTGQTLLVSRSAPTGLAPEGEPADGESFEATFVGDSDCEVAFLGVGTTNLDPGDEDPALGVYLRDFCSSPPTTTLVSIRQGGEPFEEAVSPIATGDGRIGFEGQNPFPETRHFYLRDVAAGQTTPIDRASGAEGEPADREVEWNAVSANGCRAAFTSTASNLVGEGVAPAEKRQAYVRQLTACKTPEVPAGPPGTEKPASANAGPGSAAPTHLRIVRLGRMRLVLEFSGPGVASVKVKRLVIEPRHHWKQVKKLLVQVEEAGWTRVEMPRLSPGRYRIGVHLRGSQGQPLVRLLTIGNPR